MNIFKGFLTINQVKLGFGWPIVDARAKLLFNDEDTPVLINLQSFIISWAFIDSYYHQNWSF